MKIGIDKSVRRVMEQYAPAYFVIDRQHQILRFSGSEARHYLEPSPGVANLNLFSLLQKTLRPAVRAAVEQAFADAKSGRQRRFDDPDRWQEQAAHVDR